jgi:hypothetical protein
MDKTYIPIIGLVIVSVIMILGLLIPIYIENQKEHEQLRNMTCDDDILVWIKEHDRYVDHQAYARELFQICVLGDQLNP